MGECALFLPKGCLRILCSDMLFHQIILVKQTLTPILFTPFLSPFEHVPITCNNIIPVSKIKRKKHDMKFKSCIAVESRIYIMYRCRYWKWVHHVRASYAITEMSRGCQSEYRFMISLLSPSQSPRIFVLIAKHFAWSPNFQRFDFQLLWPYQAVLTLIFVQYFKGIPEILLRILFLSAITLKK